MQRPQNQVWYPSAPHQSIHGRPDSNNSVSFWMQMDPPGLGETNHLGLDVLQARKIQVSCSEEREGDQPVPPLSRRYLHNISHRETCEEPRKNL